MTTKEPAAITGAKAEKQEAEERSSPGGHILCLAGQSEGEKELERTEWRIHPRPGRTPIKI
jgi:hypothetical protein